MVLALPVVLLNTANMLGFPYTFCLARLELQVSLLLLYSRSRETFLSPNHDYITLRSSFLTSLDSGSTVASRISHFTDSSVML